MKFKKIIPVSLLSLLCLASCGNDSYYGVYKFLLGRQGDDQVRVGLTMNLLSDKVSVDVFDEEKGDYVAKDFEKFTVEADIGSMKDALISGLVDDFALDEELLEGFEIPDSIEGYYEVLDEKDEKYGNKMAVGFVVDAEIGFDIPDETIRNLLVTYVDSKAVTLQIPVSITDLQMQLAWYGTYIDFDPYVKERLHSIEDFEKYILDIAESLKVYDLGAFKKLPGETGNKRFGSHPIVSSEEGKEIDQVFEMNAYYEGLFSNTIVYENVGGEAGKKIGSIYGHTMYDASAKPVDTYYYFYPLAEDMDFSDPFDCIVKAYDSSQNRYITEDLLTLDCVKKDNYLINHCYKGLEEIKISSTNYYQEPFEFRDFHDIKIQLMKE